ncbi:MAG: trehalose-6-phosphate synthase, partial [Ramlibacter sp.]
PLGQMLVVQELGPAEHRSEVARRSLIALIAGLGLVTALVTSVVAQLTLRRWVRATRSLLRGERSKGKGPSDAPELEPVAAELHARLRDLEDDCRRSRVPGLEWDAQRLQLLLRAELSGDEVIVVSNREPYVHERLPGGGVRVLRPASGLVTAVEPIVRACSGTWIAHGSGSADRDTVDHEDRVALPPGGSDYHLRRVWLSPEQEQGYYSGFSNEGLWPLCHVAHVRPVFRDADWQHYREVNQRFADAVVAEARSEDPVILVQDYHLALLPAMVRRKLPRATILTFWHIPWPNPESFGICPWRKELLEGLLGSTILGFHTPTHCMNFLETADRHLEARIEHEHSAISLRGEQTFVQSYPISIAWPSAETCEAWAPPDECRRRVIESLQIPAHHRLAVGVDRLDYTKGILERLHAVERLLEKHPQWRDRFTFVQIAAPTRSSLEEYQAFRQRIDALARRINQRFGGEHDVVRLLMEHHESDALTTLYRAADVCLVTSLHDGMNLVCKEFIAARDDEQGVLVLSSFAGAARDLPEALVVNPYHVEEVADAIHRALTMPELEQRERMADLRSTVRESNVFRWAGWMLGDAARLRRRERSSLRVLRHGQRRVGVVRH